MKLNVFKLRDDARLPVYSTERSTCFDLFAHLEDGEAISGRSVYNRDIRTIVIGGTLTLQAGDRMMIPTGLIFDIPEGYSIRIHPRSGLALKSGLNLVNCEGVVDEDYVNPTFVLIQNTSLSSVQILNGDRIAQGEIVKVDRAEFVNVSEAPTQKTDRNGGFGSTGV